MIVAHSRWKSNLVRRLAVAAVGCTAIGAAALFVFDRWVASSTASRLYSVESPPPTFDVGLVLGTSPTTVDGRKNLFFTTGITAPLELYKSGRVRHLLVSGDNRAAGYDEPTAMRDALIAGGVPNDAITLDYACFRTLDSVVRAHQVFGQQRVLVISQAFHCQRAVFIAAARGIDAAGYCAAEPGGAAALKVRLREVVARTLAVLDVHVFSTEPHFPGPPEPIVVVNNAR